MTQPDSSDRLTPAARRLLDTVWRNAGTASGLSHSELEARLLAVQGQSYTLGYRDGRRAGVQEGLDATYAAAQTAAAVKERDELREALAVVLRAYDYRAVSYGLPITNDRVLAQIEDARKLLSKSEEQEGG